MQKRTSVRRSSIPPIDERQKLRIGCDTCAFASFILTFALSRDERALTLSSDKREFRSFILPVLNGSDTDSRSASSYPSFQSRMRRTRTPGPPMRMTATLVRSVQRPWRGVQSSEALKKAPASVASHGSGAGGGGGADGGGADGGGDGWARPTAVRVYAPSSSCPPLPNFADPSLIK